MSKIVFLDNLQPDIKNNKKFINHHKPSYGVVSIQCKTVLGYFCKLNTGMYLYRNSSYVDYSPYGWSNFHKLITTKFSANQKEFNKLETFDIECRYLIGIHISNLRPLFPDNNFTRELNRQENKQFEIFVSEFSEKYEQLFKQFRFEEQLQKMYSELEDFGITV